MNVLNVQTGCDRLAIILSSVCAAHCLLTPVLLIALPALGASVLADEMFHFAMLVLVVPTSAFAMTLGCRKHKDGLTLLFGTLGMLILLFAAFAGHDLVDETGERILTLAGSIVLIIGHLRNFSRCRQSNCDRNSL